MKIVKAILLIVILLVVIVVGGSLFLPRNVHVERSIVIAAPAQLVFDHVNDLRAWEAWSPWQEKEPDAEHTYSGAESGVGATNEWKGEEVGEGSQEITLSESTTRIETKLMFKGQRDARSDWSFEEADGRTTVVWGFDGDMGMNSIGKIFGLMMDSTLLGPDYERGLERLKQVCEAEPATDETSGSHAADVTENLIVE